MESPTKLDDLGSPHFRQPPNDSCHFPLWETKHLGDMERVEPFHTCLFQKTCRGSRSNKAPPFSKRKRTIVHRSIYVNIYPHHVHLLYFKYIDILLYIPTIVLFKNYWVPQARWQPPLPNLNEGWLGNDRSSKVYVAKMRYTHTQDSIYEDRLCIYTFMSTYI